MLCWNALIKPTTYAICSPDADDSSVQAVVQMPYDKDMKRKYAKHLKSSERYGTPSAQHSLLHTHVL